MGNDSASLELWNELKAAYVSIKLKGGFSVLAVIDPVGGYPFILCRRIN